MEGKPKGKEEELNMFRREGGESVTHRRGRRRERKGGSKKRENG